MTTAPDTRTRIQEVARELFLKQGVQNTSLKHIADRLGITKPALYYHFASRDDLLKSIVQPFLDDMEAFLTDREPTGRRQLLEEYFDVIWRHRDVFTVFLQASATLVELNLMDRIWEGRKRLVALLLGPDSSTAAQIRATVALGGLADCVMEHATVPFDEVRTIAVEAALNALAL
ncbi:AcrR family transcriptional regulator [Streptosporangium becharense]|uniref:AcrR family transcriptional regulator n=1 Tax=Streptosporangium becharense TaxID=1816182 RepID=A0A7W9IBD7_9ACTN|nr:TetR/AcrR family transcriptional regulator [Streptosporangium becharense]MBB2915289.1 AcrR family transcriptional regulator [Streptosporangium becharense]MBB5817013.1 AcrR family transcriptional regulator [Streptosporangium becharense]